MNGLELPTVVLDGGGGTVEVSDGWTPDELDRVRDAQRALLVGGEAAVALGPAVWAAGRRGAVRSRWVRVTAAEVDRVGGHPAWLWTEPGWLDPIRTRDGRRAPAALPLRNLVGAMTPIGGRHRRAVKTLAAAVAAFRGARPPDGGVSVRVSPDLLASASRPGRALVLAWLTVLPRSLRDPLSVAVGAIDGGFDLAVTDRPVAGTTVIDASDPPDEGDDLVAYFLRNRLYADDPEGVESAAWMYDGEPDRWGEGIAARIREGLPGVSDLDPALLDNDPERAVRALAARIRAGAPLDAAVVAHLIATTLVTRDPRPWRALERRPAGQRADAVDALLAHAATFRPSAELVEALLAAQPRGAPLDRWMPALLSWLAGGAATQATLHAIETTLLEWPLSSTAPTRVSVWAEVVGALVRLGQDEQAMDALTGPVAAQIALDGASRALVAGWATVPASFRDPRRLDRLVGLLRGVPDGDQAAADLFRLVRARDDEAAVVVRGWVGRSAEVPSPTDRLFALVRETPLVHDWAETLAVGSRAWTPEAHAHWTAVCEALVAQNPSAEVALGELLRLPLPVVAAAGLPLLEPVLAGTSGEPLARLAEGAAPQPDASPVWGVVAVTLAPPDYWDEAVVDGTVIEFLEHPGSALENRVARLSFARLGATSAGEPVDLARWVVRLVHGPQRSKGSAFLVAFAQGLRGRPAAVPTLAAIVEALLTLDRDHPASLALLQVLPEAGWSRPDLRGLLDAIGTDRLPADLVARLAKAGW